MIKKQVLKMSSLKPYLRRLFLLGMAVLFYAGLSAQVVVTIPVNNDDDDYQNYPYGASDAYSRTHALYTYNEIGLAGNITSIGFYVNDLNGPAASTPVVIKMKNTTKNAVTSSSYDDASTDAITVYTGNILNTQLSVGSWVVVNLPVPFTYAGHNLEVFVEMNMGFSGSENWDAKQFRWSETGNNVSQTWSDWSTPPGPDYYGYVSTRHPNVRFSIATAPAMSYNTSSVTQASAPAYKGVKKKNIVGIQVDMNGLNSPLTATSFNLNTTGSSTVPGVIENARLYYTGINSVFDTAVQFGSTVLSPSGPFTVNGTQVLDAGRNYFWLTYDVAASAVAGDSLDASCTQITIGTNNYVPSTTSPAGNIPIGELYDFEPPASQSFTTATLGNSPSLWQRGTPTAGPSTAFSGTNCWGTNLSGDYGRSSEYVLLTPSYVTASGDVQVNYKQWFDFSYTYNDLDASFEYEVNGSGVWYNLNRINNQSRANSNNAWDNVNGQVPLSAGDTVRFRWHFTTYNYADPASGWYIDNFVVSGVSTYNQVYVSSTTNQAVAIALPGNRKQEVIGVVIEAKGSQNPLPLSSLSFSTGNASTSIIESARVFYTGGNRDFDTTTQFGSAVPFPSGFFMVSGTQQLMHGPNYFWLAYDITPTATVGDSVDATCSQIAINFNPYTPDETDPAGVIMLGKQYDFDTTGTQDFTVMSLNNSPSEWEKGTPTYGPSGAYSGTDCWGTNLGNSYQSNQDYVLTSPPYVAQSDVVTASYYQWFDFAWTWAGVTAEFQYQVNNSGFWQNLDYIDNSTYASSDNNWQKIFTQAYASVGDTIQFRWHFRTDQWISSGPGWFIDNFVIGGLATYNQSFLGASSRGLYTGTSKGTKDQPIFSISVDMTGTINPQSLTALNFNTNGTGTALNIKAAKVYYTGNNPKFETGNQFGVTVNNPSGIFNITGSQSLLAGTNYFWLTYDVDSAAQLNDSLDGEITQITLGGNPYTPDITAPDGRIYIGKLYNFDTTTNQNFITSAQNSHPNQWEKGTPTYGPSGAYSGTDCWATNLSGDYNTNSDYVLETPPYVITLSDVNISFKHWFDFMYTWAGITADFEYNLNQGGWGSIFSIDNSTRATSQNNWETVESYLAGMTPGDTISFRWRFTSDNWATLSSGWYIDNFLISGAQLFNQQFLASDCRQVSEATVSGTRNQAIISIAVETNGSENPLTATSFDLSTNGSAFGIIQSARLFYTGSNKSFDSTAQFGSTVSFPSGAFNITGSQPLSSGVNYFWLAYDVASNAQVGDSLDGECSQVTVSAANHIPSNTAPIGNIPVGRLFTFDTTGLQDFTTASLNANPTQWEKGIPNSGPYAALSGSDCWATNLNGDYTRNARYTFNTPPYVANSDVLYASYNQWFDFVYTYNDVYAEFQYNVNNQGWSTLTSIDNYQRANSDYQWEKVATPVYVTKGDTVQFRWYFETLNYTQPGAGWYVDDFLVSNVSTFNQQYKESYAEQLGGVTHAGVQDQPVIRIAVDVAGSGTPLSVSSLDLSIGNSTPLIIKSAKVFYTGLSNTFSTATQFGAQVLNPFGAFNISGSQELTSGVNYFWLAYSLDTTAQAGDSVDGIFSQVTLNGFNLQMPTTTDPAGKLPVGRLYNFDVASNEDFSTQSLNGKSVDWERGVPTVGPATAYSGTNCWGTNLNGDFELKRDYALLTPPFLAKSTEINLSYKQWFDFTYTSWDKRAEFQYQVNKTGPWMNIRFIDLQNVASSNNQWLNEEAIIPVNPGDTVQFRWHLYTSSYDQGPGWYIDNFLLSDAEALDGLPPSITYTPLSHTSSTANRVLTNFAQITDLTGVDVTFGNKPRIYYKKKSEANAFGGNSSFDNGWKYTEITNGTTPFSFEINYSLLYSPLALGDTIEYFVTAQDVNFPANTGAYPSAGFEGTSVSAIVSAPTTPFSFIITAAPMAGNYNVGTGQTYTTLTAAVRDVNLRGISAPVSLTLMNNTFGLATGETFPITFYPVTGASAVNTVTVKPGTGVSPVFTTNNAIFKLQGADYIIIDGSNSGTTSRDLSMVSTGTTGMVWICANSSTDGATYNTVKNCVIQGNQTTKFGVYSGHTDYTVKNSGTQAPNSNNRIENNLITKTMYGVCLVGASKNKPDVNNVITGNQLGDASNAISLLGIYTIYHTGDQIVANEIRNIDFAYNNLYEPCGGIFADQSKQVLISKNKISNWKCTMGDARLTGIRVDGGEYGWDNAPVPTNNIIANNFIGDGYATSTNTWNILGISMYNGNGDKVYFNTVNFSGNILQTDGTVIAFECGNSNTLNMDIRNNIFQINGTSTLNPYYYGYMCNLDFSKGNISDYNVLSCTAGGSATAVLGQYNYSDVYTLADWKSNTGQGANSKDGLVTFVSAADLHLAGASIGDTVNLLGTTIAGFATDIDGDVRTVGAPYIGADENTGTPLPVNLIEFNAIAKQADVLLNWATASERNNKGFVVERSVNNREFEEAGFVAGRGNSKITATYRFTDKDAFNNAPVLYYRLKQVDNDGRFEYSKTVRVSKGETPALAQTVVYPNPFNKEVFVQFEADGTLPVNVTLMDLTGRVVLNRSLETVKGINTMNVLDNEGLESGVYFLTIEMNGNRQVHKLIKQ